MYISSLYTCYDPHSGTRQVYKKSKSNLKKYFSSKHIMNPEYHPLTRPSLYDSSQQQTPLNVFVRQKPPKLLILPLSLQNVKLFMSYLDLGSEPRSQPPRSRTPDSPEPPTHRTASSQALAVAKFDYFPSQ